MSVRWTHQPLCSQQLHAGREGDLPHRKRSQPLSWRGKMEAESLLSQSEKMFPPLRGSQSADSSVIFSLFSMSVYSRLPREPADVLQPVRRERQTDREGERESEWENSLFSETEDPLQSDSTPTYCSLKCPLCHPHPTHSDLSTALWLKAKELKRDASRLEREKQREREKVGEENGGKGMGKWMTEGVGWRVGGGAVVVGPLAANCREQANGKQDISECRLHINIAFKNLKAGSEQGLHLLDWWGGRSPANNSPKHWKDVQDLNITTWKEWCYSFCFVCFVLETLSAPEHGARVKHLHKTDRAKTFHWGSEWMLGNVCCCIHNTVGENNVAALMEEETAGFLSGLASG